VAANDTRGTWAVAVVILFFLVGGPAHAQITSGTYAGNGTAGRAITGLGFQPDVVIVKVDYSHATDDLSSGVVRTSTMSGVNSKPVKGSQNPLPNLITSIDTDGFTVGNDLMVNDAATCSGACTYYWVAAQANAHVKVGTYTGSSTGAGDTLWVTRQAPFGVDVTDPVASRWLASLKQRSGSVRFKTEEGHRYVLASSEGLLSPRISKPVQAKLRRRTNQADYVVIAPEAFLVAAQPLLQRRQDQRLTTKAVSFEQITSQFGHGRPSAQAIRDFLTYAFHNWQTPSVRYVLLLGDASYDPRNFTGSAKGAPLPAMRVKTSYLWTSSDPTLGAVNGEDSLPDLAIGRLPATTLEEAHSLVQKVLAWEDTAQSLSGTAILVADNPDRAGDFEAGITDIQASFLGGRETKTLLLRQLGANTRPEILAALDEGASLLSYVGHGGPAVWAPENVLNSWDPPKLLAQSEQPLI